MRHLTDLGQTHQKVQPKHKGRTGQLATIIAVFNQALQVARFVSKTTCTWECEEKELEKTLCETAGLQYYMMGSCFEVFRNSKSNASTPITLLSFVKGCYKNIRKIHLLSQSLWRMRLWPLVKWNGTTGLKKMPCKKEAASDAEAGQQLGGSRCQGKHHWLLH